MLFGYGVEGPAMRKFLITTLLLVGCSDAKKPTYLVSPTKSFGLECSGTHSLSVYAHGREVIEDLETPTKRNYWWDHVNSKLVVSSEGYSDRRFCEEGAGSRCTLNVSEGGLSVISSSVEDVETRHFVVRNSVSDVLEMSFDSLRVVDQHIEEGGVANGEDDTTVTKSHVVRDMMCKVMPEDLS